MILALGGPVPPLALHWLVPGGTLFMSQTHSLQSRALRSFVFLPGSSLISSCLSLHLLLGLQNPRDLVDLLVTPWLKTSPPGITINHTF